MTVIVTRAKVPLRSTYKATKKDANTATPQHRFQDVEVHQFGHLHRHGLCSVLQCSAGGPPPPTALVRQRAQRVCEMFWMNRNAAILHRTLRTHEWMTLRV